MYNTTATELKQKTKWVLKQAQTDYVIVNKYDQPEAAIISIRDLHLLEQKKKEIAVAKKQGKTLHDRLKHLAGTLDTGITDSVKLVREWRDDE